MMKINCIATISLSGVLLLGILSGCASEEEELIESGVEKRVSISSESALVIRRAGDEEILLIVSNIDGDLMVQLLDDRTPTTGFSSTADGKRIITHDFTLDDGRHGKIFDADGDGLPERKIIFSSGELPGKTEWVRYQFEDARAEQDSDGNAEKPPGVEREP